MAETSHELRRDIEVTREQVGDTIAALERKVNPRHLINDYPLAAVGVAFGTGVLLGSTGAVRRTARTVGTQVRAQVRAQSHRLSGSNDGAGGNPLDRILQGIVQAATTAGTAKLAMLMEQVAGQYGAGGGDTAGAPSQAPLAGRGGGTPRW